MATKAELEKQIRRLKAEIVKLQCRMKDWQAAAIDKADKAEEEADQRVNDESRKLYESESQLSSVRVAHKNLMTSLDARKAEVEILQQTLIRGIKQA